MTKLQVADADLVEECGETWIAQPDFVGVGIELQPERRLYQREGRAAGPGLRRTGDRIKRRAAATAALKAAEQLRQAAHVHIGCGVEKTAKHPFELVLQPIFGEAE